MGSNLPQAYLKYIYYDTQGNYLSSGYQLLSAAANGACELLSLDLPADRDGYVQVFVANESNANVWFDDLTLTHSVAPIVQENHYDPFGLHLGGLVERQGTPEYPFQYNAGSEKQLDAVGYGYSYATDWRGYDPQLGRFHGIDALAHEMPGINPYQYGYNNPVMFNDPTGENPLLGLAIGAVAGAAVGGTVSAIQGNGFWSGAWKGALIGAGVGAAVGWGVQAWGGGSSALGTPGYMTPAAPQDFLTSRGVGGGVGEVAQKVAEQVSQQATPYYVPSAAGQSALRGVGDFLASNSKMLSDVILPQASGRLFTNETAAYNYMWKNSFDGKGKVTTENFAWLTSRGVLTLPTSGYSPDGRYLQNTSSTSEDEYLPLKQVNNRWLVKYENTWLKIQGSVHTHPNGGSFPISGEDFARAEYYKRGFPLFTITRDGGVYAGYLSRGVRTIIEIGSRDELLRGKIVIRPNLHLLK